MSDRVQALRTASVPRLPRFVDRERVCGPDASLRVAIDELRTHAMSVEIVRAPILPDLAGSRAMSARLIGRDGTVLGEGTGKGLGAQAAASAAFEAIEHAVAFGRLGRVPTVDACLPEAPFRPSDRLYEHARRRAGTRRLPSFAFESLSSPAVTLMYPRIACDVSYVLRLPLDQDVLFLDRYPSTNGYAAGVTLGDAIRHAVHELIERDAFSGYLLSPEVPSWTARPLEGRLPTPP